MREITVAAVQMKPKLYEMGDNLTRMTDFVEKICLQQRVDLIVFPELITTGYECGVRFTDLAEKAPGHTVNLMAQQAAEFNTHIVFGMALKEKVESIIYNAAIMVGPDGELVGDYRKVHLRGEERLAFRTGFRYPVLETNFGMVGLILGWDMAFPEVARSLALDGAELLCLCASWERPHTKEWHAFSLARAFENSIFLAAANRIGEEPSYTFFGQSMIVGPRGDVYASMDEETEGYALAQVDLDEVRRLREEYQLIQLRQPATYRAIVRKY
ncbi:MAG: carbon-nitrogen hydrolase family protein [Anaerolineales bacterium]|jgi:predicted amidohydrolase|nr:MAG: carbon-nitrogen hydrolase family protein [Anaerolineales bacterium]